MKSSFVMIAATAVMVSSAAQTQGTATLNQPERPGDDQLSCSQVQTELVQLRAEIQAATSDLPARAMAQARMQQMELKGLKYGAIAVEATNTSSIPLQMANEAAQRQAMAQLQAAQRQASIVAGKAARASYLQSLSSSRCGAR